MLLRRDRNGAPCRGSALIIAVGTIAVLAAIVALLVALAVDGIRLSSARDDSAHARLLAEGWFEYGVGSIQSDTFGLDGIPYNNDFGDEGYDWPGDRFGKYTLAELREGVEVFDDAAGRGLRARVRLRIIDHESLANINAHGNFYGPDGTTNVGHGASTAEIALERALAAIDPPQSIFPDRDEVREAAHKLARQIISSARFFGLPGYFPGGDRDRIDNHARMKYAAGADANRTGFAEPNEFSRGLNDFADNSPADSAFPSFLARGRMQQRFGLDTEIAIQYARFYPDDPDTEACRIEDFARDDKACKLIEKNRLFLHCLRAVGLDKIKARALFAAVSEKVCTFSGDPDVCGSFTPRACVNNPAQDNLHNIHRILSNCGSLNSKQAEQVVANLKAYLASHSAGQAPVEFRTFGKSAGVTTFPQFSEVWFRASQKTLYFEIANPFASAPAGPDEQDIAMDMSGFEIRLKLKSGDMIFVADLAAPGSVIARGAPDDGRKVIVYRIGPGSATIIGLEPEPAPTINSANEIEWMDLRYKESIDVPYATRLVDRLPSFVFADIESKSAERRDLLAPAADPENWLPSVAPRGHSLRGYVSGADKSFNSVSVMECDAASAPYLDLGGDGNRFANVGEFFRLLTIGPSYNPETEEPFESVLEMVRYLGGHREDAKLYRRLSAPDKAALYDALTVFAPLPAAFTDSGERNIREGRININTAQRATLLSLPFAGEESGRDNIGVDDIIDEFQGETPAEKRSDIMRMALMSPWKTPLVPRSRFPLNYDDNPMPADRIAHPEEQEFVPGVMMNFVTCRSNVFTIYVEVEIYVPGAGVKSRARLVGIAHRACAGPDGESPVIRVIMKHFLGSE